MIENNFLIDCHPREPEDRTISPFVETKEGALFYKQQFLNPQFLNLSSQILLFEEQVVVDHYVLLFDRDETLNNYAKTLVECGGQINEGPGQWPDEFCPELESELFQDLSMYFLSASMPSGVILVLIAPSLPEDPLTKMLKQRGPNIVHHVAILVDEVSTAVEIWKNKGFFPLSDRPQDDGSLCQWFLSNSVGQIIELISRRKKSLATFSCNNIIGLRLSELNRQ